MSNFRLSPVDTDQDYDACFEVMRELRPHLTDVAAFAAQARRQARQGYCLLAAWQNNKVMGLAGYRTQENLMYGKFMYVDDLVTTREARSQGIGAKLIDATRKKAQELGCAWFVLDTAAENALGQRFYYRQGLLGLGIHFNQQLQPLSKDSLIDTIQSKCE